MFHKIIAKISLFYNISSKTPGTNQQEKNLNFKENPAVLRQRDQNQSSAKLSKIIWSNSCLPSPFSAEKGITFTVSFNSRVSRIS